MYKKRIEKVADSLLCPAYIVNNIADLFYLTGMPIDGYWLLITARDIVAFAPPLLAGHLSSVLKNIRIIESENMVDALTSFLICKKIKTIGIYPHKLSYSLGEKLASKLKIEKLKFDPVGAQRIIKDETEIKLIKKSCKIASQAAGYAKKIIRPGMTEEQVSCKIEEFFARNGARPSFLPIVASGPNSASPHNVCSNRKLKKNDIILLDIGCIYKGYSSDLTRTFFLGKINDLALSVYNMVDEAYLKALSAVRDGVKASEIDMAARRVISGYGYGRQFIHSVGHGVGIEVHEPPRLSKSDETVLRAGMVVTVEPGIYIPGKFGVRIENTILITGKGIEVLT